MEKQLDSIDIEALVEEGLNAACLLIQQRLGVEDGDLAAVFFSDDITRNDLRAYAKQELDIGEGAVAKRLRGGDNAARTPAASSPAATVAGAYIYRGSPLWEPN